MSVLTKKANNHIHIIYGVHPVLELIQKTGFSQTDELYVSKNSNHTRLTPLMKKAQKSKVSIIKLTHKQINEMIQKYQKENNMGMVNHQGVLLIRKESFLYKELTLQDILTSENTCADSKKYLILDRIQDPQNLGAIIRTSVALNIEGIILSSKNSAPLGATAWKVSSGAMANMKFLQTTQLHNTIKAIYQQPKNLIIGTDLEAPHINPMKITQWIKQYSNIFFIMGSEHGGVNSLFLDLCHETLSLKQNNQINSLNVSVSTGILIYLFEMNS